MSSSNAGETMTAVITTIDISYGNKIVRANKQTNTIKNNTH